MMKYDVIIIGAGPAGLSCAWELSASKMKVLVLDKNPNPGNKICAGGMRIEDVKKIGLPNKFIGIKDKGFVTVDRQDFFNHAFKKVFQTNVEIKLGVNVKSIDSEFLTTNDNSKFGFKYLVGADGSNSIVRKSLGIPVNEKLVTIQYKLYKFKWNNLHFDFNKQLFNEGYGWIFPHTNHSKVGCGTLSGGMPVKELKNNFKFWLRENRIETEGEKPMTFPINCDYRNFKYDNIFLAGDAAGFADKVSGEGIHQALISGQEIARIIKDNKYQSRILGDLVVQKLIGKSSIKSAFKQK